MRCSGGKRGWQFEPNCSRLLNVVDKLGKFSLSERVAMGSVMEFSSGQTGWGSYKLLYVEDKLDKVV